MTNVLLPNGSESSDQFGSTAFENWAVMPMGYATVCLLEAAVRKCIRLWPLLPVNRHTPTKPTIRPFFRTLSVALVNGSGSPTVTTETP